MFFLRSSQLQLVADAVDRAYRVVAGTHLLELAAQVLDVRVDRAVGDYAVVFVEPLQELVAREHASRRRSEGAEKAEFNRGEIELLAVELGDMQDLVNGYAVRRG